MPIGYSKKKNEEWRRQARMFDTRPQTSKEDFEAEMKKMYPNWREIQKRNKEKYK